MLGRDSSYFVEKKDSKSSPTYTKDDIFKMLEFSIENICVQCGGRVLTTVDIPIGTNDASLLADLFLHSYEADFIADLIQIKEHSFRYTDDVLPLNSSTFGEFIH